MYFQKYLCTSNTVALNRFLWNVHCASENCILTSQQASVKLLPAMIHHRQSFTARIEDFLNTVLSEGNRIYKKSLQSSPNCWRPTQALSNIHSLGPYLSVSHGYLFYPYEFHNLSWDQQMKEWEKGKFYPTPTLSSAQFIHFITCSWLHSVSSSPGSACIHPCFKLFLPQWQQLVVQLTSKIALGCSKNYHSFSSGAQPMWPHSNYLFTIHLKSPLTSQSVAKWNKHWFVTRCMNLSAIRERKENRSFRNNQRNNFWILVWK